MKILTIISLLVLSGCLQDSSLPYDIQWDAPITPLYDEGDVVGNSFIMRISANGGEEVLHGEYDDDGCLIINFRPDGTGAQGYICPLGTSGLAYRGELLRRWVDRESPPFVASFKLYSNEFSPPPLPDKELVSEPQGAEGAIRFIASELELRLDVPTGAELPDVVWFRGDCIQYEEGANACDNCRDGCAHRWGPDAGIMEIHLAQRLGELPSDTALAHEMIHWGLWKAGDPSAGADHAADIWWQHLEMVDLLAAQGF